MIKLLDVAKRLLTKYLSPRRRIELGLMLRHRKHGYRLLSGRGIEIGALHIPAFLPPGCETVYADAITTEEARRIFPEISHKDLAPVSLKVDLDKSGLAGIDDGAFDYAILNHVIEHVANPVGVVGEIFRVVKPGGYVVLSAPDKNFTFDKPRALTDFSHLAAEFEAGVTNVTDDHYEDFVRSVQHHGKPVGAERLQVEMQAARDRREHAHVWDSESFADFMARSLKAHALRADPVFVSQASDNKFEYFGVWQKQYRPS
jgi:SAM-dependent methyltransferase